VPESTKSVELNTSNDTSTKFVPESTKSVELNTSNDTSTKFVPDSTKSVENLLLKEFNKQINFY